MDEDRAVARRAQADMSLLSVAQAVAVGIAGRCGGGVVAGLIALLVDVDRDLAVAGQPKLSRFFKPI